MLLRSDMPPIALGSDDVGEPNKTTRTTRSKFYDKYVRPFTKKYLRFNSSWKRYYFFKYENRSYLFKPNNKNNNEGIYSVYFPTWAKGASL